MPDARIVALFLDGTWNTVDDDTNVWRLKSLCQKIPSQTVYYSAGVGTQFGEVARGGMLGYGLDREVMQAYEWLIDNYSEGDSIFIFGFSRGAYTARSLSGLISKCGLSQAGGALSVKQLYARYRLGKGVPTIRELPNTKKSLTDEDKWLLKYSRAVPIKFIGVWDTVGALGIPFGNIPGLSRREFQFLETDLRINNDHAYHALAVDENRKAFAPTLWTRTVPKEGTAYPARKLEDVEQRWFVGAHGNVGGGYPSDLLAQLPLKWLMSKATLHGMRFTNALVMDDDENKAPIGDSFSEFMGGLYKLVKFGQRYWRPIQAAPILDTQGGQTTTINETIDRTVFDRWRKDERYRPASLAAWAEARGVSIGGLTASVRADDPTQAVPEE